MHVLFNKCSKYFQSVNAYTAGSIQVKSSPCLFICKASYLSPAAINDILRKNEYIYEPKEVGPVKRIFVNQLAANKPCEDRGVVTISKKRNLKGLQAENGKIDSKTYKGNDFMFSVIDGHAGHYCAEYIVQQIHEYLAYALANNRQYNDQRFDFHQILPKRQHAEGIIFDGKPNDSWRSYCQNHYNSDDTQSLLRKCFEQLDSNLIVDANNAADKLLECAELSLTSLTKLIKTKVGEHLAMNGVSDIVSKTRPFIQAAGSGACCCTVMINDNKLSVASAGDCFAVLGKVIPPSKMSTYETVDSLNLTIPHNYWNPVERNRILNAHPHEDFAINSERLLACLLPFRAFGDLNFKLPLSLLNSKYRKLLGSSFILPNYITPPYLTSNPDTMSIDLHQDTDRFILIASDGLSDMISNQAAVSVIHQFLSIECALEPISLLDVKNRHLKLSVLSKELDSRANALSKYHVMAASPRTIDNAGNWQEENRTKPLLKSHNILQRLYPYCSTKSSKSNQSILNGLIDRNAATYLLRHALSGGNQNGVDYSMLEYLLSHSNPRMVRDDITIIIVQLNVDYLSTINNNDIIDNQSTMSSK